jgi:arsenate reductase
MRILILCTGNSCRSQMAEAFLKSFDPTLEVFSAGTSPAKRVHPKTIDVMREIGIEMFNAVPKKVDEFLLLDFDYVITVCDHAKESCPVFTGKVKQAIHLGFEDPAETTGNEDEILSAFRRMRDKIKERFYLFYRSGIKNSPGS